MVSSALVALPQVAQATNFEGNYYVSTANGTGSESIFQFDPTTSTIGSTAISTFAASNEITSLEVDGTNGIAYAATYGWDSSHVTQFWTIDLASGVATLTNADMSTTAGLNDHNVQDFALDPVSGTLYARSETGNKLYTIDKTTGTVTASVTPTGDSSLALGAGLAISGTQEMIWSGNAGGGTSPNKYTKLGVLSSPFSSTMVIGRTVFNGSSNLSIPMQSIDYAPDGSLVMWSGPSSTTGKFGMISAAALGALDHVGTAGTSSTATTLATNTSTTNGSTGGYMLAVANVAPAMARTVSYDPNTGSGTETATVGAGAVTVSSGTHMTLAGHTLSGWNTAANGTGASVALGASFTPSANLTLYAQWTLTPVAAGYSGPLFNPIENRSVNSTTGGKITLTGRVLSKVSKISIGTAELSFVKTADGNLDVTVPAGKPGLVDLKVTFEGGSLVWENAFRYVDPASVKPPFVYHAPKPVKKPVKKKK